MGRRRDRPSAVIPILDVHSPRHPDRRSPGAVPLLKVAALLGRPVALASAAAYFSIGGLVELFPAQATAVAVLGAILEATKLVMAGWLAANWRAAGGLLRGCCS